MKTFNVSLVGVGGQGILLTADLLAKTAAIAGLDVKKSEIHGMAQRGGSVISQVRFGSEVASPIIQEGTSDILVSFDKLEALRWAHLLAKGGKCRAVALSGCLLICHCHSPHLSSSAMRERSARATL